MTGKVKSTDRRQHLHKELVATQRYRNSTEDIIQVHLRRGDVVTDNLAKPIKKSRPTCFSNCYLARDKIGKK